MNGLWFIARHEYKKKVLQRSFIIATLAVPLMLVLIMGVAVLSAIGSSNHVLGYIDQAGMFDSVTAPAVEGSTHMVEYPDLEVARRAVETGEVRAVYLIPADYRQGGKPVLYLGENQLNQMMRADFDAFLRDALVKQASEHIPARLFEPPQIVAQSLDGAREFSEENIINIMVPFLAAFAFIFVVLMTAGTLLKVVAEEKDNRTIEILITSISPEQLIGGKALGLLGVCLTQIGIWFAAAALALLVGAQFFEPLRNARVPGELLLTLVLFFIPSYALISALMTAIGGAAGEMRQGQQVAGLLNMLFILPLFLTAMLLNDPNGPLAVFLTLFPTTAFATVALRWGFTTIPLWQMVVSWLLLMLSSVLAVWASARVFRLGMLRYGQGLNLKAAIQGLTGSREAASSRQSR